MARTLFFTGRLLQMLSGSWSSPQSKLVLVFRPLLAASRVLEVDLGSLSEEQEEEQEDRVSLSVLVVDNEACTLLRLRGDACIIAINSLT